MHVGARLTAIVLLLAACSRGLGAEGTNSTQTQEIARVVSPDSVVDAVLTRSNVDATTPFVYRVYLVPRSGAIPKESGRELFRADQVDSLSLAWLGPKRLEIRYDRARIFHFSNFWNSGSVENFEYVVELHLRSLNHSSGGADSSH